MTTATTQIPVKRTIGPEAKNPCKRCMVNGSRLNQNTAIKTSRYKGFPAGYQMLKWERELKKLLGEDAPASQMKNVRVALRKMISSRVRGKELERKKGTLAKLLKPASSKIGGSSGARDFVGLYGGRNAEEDRRYFAEYKSQRHNAGLE